MTYLCGEGVQEFDELEAGIFDVSESLSDHQVQRLLGFTQQSTEPNLHIPLCCDRMS